MTREIKIPKKKETEREREEMGRNAHIERKLLATAGESSWQIPGMLVEITFDRLVIRQKKKEKKDEPLIAVKGEICPMISPDGDIFLSLNVVHNEGKSPGILMRYEFS